MSGHLMPESILLTTIAVADDNAHLSVIWGFFLILGWCPPSHPPPLPILATGTYVVAPFFQGILFSHPQQIPSLFLPVLFLKKYTVTHWDSRLQTLGPQRDIPLLGCKKVFICTETMDNPYPPILTYLQDWKACFLWDTVEFSNSITSNS